MPEKFEMSERLELENAWNWRQQRGILGESEALRVFHGPGEGTGLLKNIAVDRFGPHYWITEWEGESRQNAADSRQSRLRSLLQGFLSEKGASSAVVLWRPQKGIPSEPEKLMGEPPECFDVREGDACFSIRFLGARHPGLFLDHQPLRSWLRARARSWKVLNTFAYTGSLSVAAGLGGAEHVTTVDLSKATIRWAQENWELNHLPSAAAKFIAGDVFEWLPRLTRSGDRFDCVILDPPSFSHGVKGSFSTSKDLVKLHVMAMGLLAETGVLVTSINSANIARPKFESDVLEAARQCGLRFETLRVIDLPETFPTSFHAFKERYLKGLVLRRSFG